MTDRRSGNSIENLRDTIEELTLDIGRILHANTSTLLMVSQTLIATIETLTSRSISPSDINVDEIESDVANVARRLAGALEKMGEAGTQSRREEALSSSDWEVLA
ncbi:MAG: hypothetical protein O7H39_18525, partial [Gammaproteobacteria bacterium]|nr:hypothetical protein [Gammaproteobacteria bacterium]